MDGGVVQHRSALRHPQEPRALFKGLGSQLGHLQDLPAGGEGPVLLPVLYQILRRGGGEPRHPLEQGRGGRVHVHAHGVNAVLHHVPQGLVQPLAGHVVLILTHADGLGIDLHQLRQGVLEPPGDGDRGPEVHVVLRELLRRQGRGGVHRRAGLADDHIADPAPHLPQQLHSHLLRLPGGGAVADGDARHAVAADKARQDGDALRLFPLPVGGIDHGGVQHLSGGVHHRHLTPHAVARIQAHGHPALYRRLHQQGPEIQGKVVDGPLAGLIREGIADLPLQGGVQEPVIGVLRHGLHELHGPGSGPHHRPAEQGQGLIPVSDHDGLQSPLPLPPVDGQDLVALEAGDGLGEVVVEPVDRVLLRGRLAHQLTPLEHQLPEALADGRVVADGLGDDVAGPLECVGQGLHALLRIHVGRSRFRGIRAVRPLGEEELRQGLQAPLPGHGGTGAALGLVGAVQVLHLRQGHGRGNSVRQSLRQLALVLNGRADLLPPLLQIAQVLEALLQGAQGGVVHGAVELLAVARDKGDGVALVQEVHHAPHVPGALVQLPGKYFNNRFHRIPPL